MLGFERIKEICQKYGLTEEDQKIIDEILNRWENLVGQPFKKMMVVDELLTSNPYIGRITRAMLEIIVEFDAESWESFLK